MGTITSLNDIQLQSLVFRERNENGYCFDNTGKPNLGTPARQDGCDLSQGSQIRISEPASSSRLLAFHDFISCDVLRAVRAGAESERCAGGRHHHYDLPDRNLWHV